MIYPDIEKEVSQKLNIPEDVVDAAYKSFYEFVKRLSLQHGVNYVNKFDYEKNNSMYLL